MGQIIKSVFLSVYVSVGKLTVAFFNRSSRNLLDRPWQVLHKGRWMTPEGAWPRSRVLLLKQWDIYPCSTERISCVINYLCLWRCLSRVSVCIQAYEFAQSACSKVGNDELFHDCNDKLQSSHYRDYCLTDTCAYASVCTLWMNEWMMFLLTCDKKTN